MDRISEIFRYHSLPAAAIPQHGDVSVREFFQDPLAETLTRCEDISAVNRPSTKIGLVLGTKRMGKMRGQRTDPKKQRTVRVGYKCTNCRTTFLR